MAISLTPMQFLETNLDPLSKYIDASGGPHVLLGLIASGGQPHIYITGNVKGTMQAEIYEALADLLRSKASTIRQGKSFSATDNIIRLS